MAEPLQAAVGVEPDLLDDRIASSKPIEEDIARGYDRQGSTSTTTTVHPSGSVLGEGPEAGRKSTTEVAPDLTAGPAIKGGKGKKDGRHGGGLTEGDDDQDELPKNNLLVVMPSVGLVLFLGALDQTIVATALPVIAEDLGATASQYSWVGTAYLLAMALMTPINGRVSDIVGRKPMLYVAIAFFIVFSALCGAAQNITWMIVCRFFQGVGGGSIIALVNIVVADIVPLEKRGLYNGYIGATWGIASVLGPIMGGALAEKASWRWTFWINLPTGGVAFLLLLFCLKLNPTRKLTFRQFCQTFDFIGLVLTMAAAALLIVGFSNAADHGFGDKSAYPIIIVGAVCLVGAIVDFFVTKRNAIIPPRMFRIRTTLFFLIGSFLHAVAFIPINFLLPQLFQGVRGASVIASGIQLLPFAIAVSVSTITAGQINARLRIVRPVVWAGYLVAAVGYGLMYRFFRYPFSIGVQTGLQILTGVGLGHSLAVPMLILQAAMPLKEVASATSAWTLTRSLGGSIGLAIYTGVLNTNLRTRFSKIPGYGTDFEAPATAAGYAQLHALPDGPTKEAVLLAFSESIALCWIIACGLVSFALACTLWTKGYSLNRRPGKSSAVEAETKPAESAEDPEKGSIAEDVPQSTVASLPEEDTTSSDTIVAPIEGDRTKQSRSPV